MPPASSTRRVWLVSIAILFVAHHLHEQWLKLSLFERLKFKKLLNLNLHNICKAVRSCRFCLLIDNHIVIKYFEKNLYSLALIGFIQYSNIHFASERSSILGLCLRMM